MKKITNVISIGVLISSIILPSYASAVTVDSQPQSSISDRDNDNVIKDNGDVSIEDTNDMVGDTDKGNDTVNSSEEIGTANSKSLFRKKETEVSTNQLAPGKDNLNSGSNEENNSSSSIDTLDTIATPEVSLKNLNPSSADENVENSKLFSDTSGVNITMENLSGSKLENGFTINGAGTFVIRTHITNSKINSGKKLTFSFDDPTILSAFNPNGGTQYGNWSVDISSGIAIFTFTRDITSEADITILLNIRTKNVTSSKTVNILTSLDDDPITVFNLNTKYVAPANGGGGGYNGQMVFPSVSKYINVPTPPNLVSNNILGTNYFQPVNTSMDFSVVYDAGFYNNGKNDFLNRKMIFEFSSNEPNIVSTILPEDIYFSDQYNVYPNKSKNFVPINTLGMTTKNLNEHTIEVSLPDNVKFSWGIFYINATAKSLTAAYTLKVTYKSDVYTEGISAEINNLRFQNTGNKGFIPNLTTQNKSIKTTDSIANVNDWLLKGVTASDEEDGDLSEEVTVSDDGGITEAIANGSTGTYTVTYTVTDSDANTVTKTSKITIYSDITVHYVDDSGNKLQEDKIISGNPGDTIFIPKNDIILENIDYYVASSNPVNITGNFGDTNQIKDVTLFYKENKQSISGSDFSMYVGDKTPTVSDFKATATDKDGKELEVTADFSKVDFSKAGTYEVTLQTTDGQTKTVKLVIKENKLDSFSKTLRKKALSRISPS